MKRRRFVATGMALSIAGCAGGDEADGESGGDGTDGASNGDAGPATGTPDGLASHPAGRDLAVQPRDGPPPGEATGTVVAFEDPSCSRCARFEREVVPELRAELVDPGTVSYVFRGYPVVYAWGDPAARVLEAVHARDAAAHWTLTDHYFENQGDYSGAEPAAVYDRTETFLAEATDLDATAVVDAARSGDADPAVQTDLSAGEAAGAGGTTPHLFLFRDGEFRTKSAGYTGLETIRGVLEL